MLQPPVDAEPVEDVAAVSHRPDLVGALELVEAHRAALRQAAMAALRKGDEVLEPDRRQALLDQLRRPKARLVVMAVGVVPPGFGLQQGAEAEAAEDPVDEPSQVGEEEEQVEEELRELRVPNREPHVGIEEPKSVVVHWERSVSRWWGKGSEGKGREGKGAHLILMLTTASMERGTRNAIEIIKKKKKKKKKKMELLGYLKNCVPERSSLLGSPVSPLQPLRRRGGGRRRRRRRRRIGGDWHGLHGGKTKESVGELSQSLHCDQHPSFVFSTVVG
ncbi:hypothetical protein GW17_00056076 [Ensete ventricosum]|nr:hypothetical protein GW17_00056076 [Ensete ventricosum]